MTKKVVFLVMLVLLLISSADILVHLNDFFYLPGSGFSDIPISHFPNLLQLQNGIINDHQIPLWSNLIQSGYPFSANPLSGIAYIWGWIAILFPLPAGINIVFVLHLTMAAFGMYFFLRAEGRSQYGSIFGAIALVLSTKVFAHFAAGHLSFLYAYFWTPWLFYFTKKIGARNSSLYRFLAGMVIGFIICADARWGVPAGMLWLAYLFTHEGKLSQKFKTSLISGLIGLLTSSAMWLPLIEYVQYTSRYSLTLAERSVYALNTANLLGLVIPNSGGLAEWVLYPSAVVILMVILGLVLVQENKPIRFWYWVAGVAMLLSFGSQIPLLKYFFEIPGISLLRVPSRFAFLTVFSFAVISAFIIDYFLSNPKGYKFDRFFFLVPVTVFLVLFAAGAYLVTSKLAWTIVWSLTFFLLGTISLGLVIHQKMELNLVPIFLGLLLFIDLSGINFINLQPKNAINHLNNKAPLMDKLESIPEFARIYTPSYSISQEEGAYWRINQINGIDPMQLSYYVDFFELTSGIKNNGYSVTLPPFKSGNPASDNRSSCPKVEKLRALNVVYVISDFTLDHCPGFSSAKIISEKYLYEFNIEPAIAFFQNNNSMVDLLSFEPNRIVLHTQSGGRLILREIFYPGWEASIDGMKTAVVQEGIFRAIEVPSGDHNIVFTYKPRLVAYGFIIQYFSLLAVVILIIREVRRERKK